MSKFDRFGDNKKNCSHKNYTVGIDEKTKEFYNECVFCTDCGKILIAVRKFRTIREKGENWRDYLKKETLKWN